MDMKKIPGFGLGLIALSLQQVYAAPLSFVDGGSHFLKSEKIESIQTPNTPTISVSNGTSLDITSSEVKTSSNYAFGILSAEKANVTIDSSKIYSEGGLSFAVAAKEVGVVNISGSDIFSTGKSYGGALSSGSGSQIVIRNSNLIATSTGNDGVQASAATSEFDGNLDISDTKIQTAGDYSSGVYLQGRGAVSINNGSIETEGNKSSGIRAISNSLAHVNGVKINTSGDESDAITAEGGSVVSIANSEIGTSGSSYGINAIHSGTTVSTSKSSITTSADIAKGVFAGSQANVQLLDTSVSTSGKGSYAVSVHGSGSQLDITNGVITTTGERDVNNNSANAVVSEFGASTSLKGNNSISTTGEFAAGLLSQVNGENLDTSLSTTGYTEVSTKGNNAVGILACSGPGVNRNCISPINGEGESDANGSKALLAMNGGKITTTGNDSYAAYAHGTNAEIGLHNVSIETAGQSSHALAVRQGNISINNSQIATIGQNANIAMITNGGMLNLDKVIATAEKSSGITINTDGLGHDATVSITDSQLKTALNVIDNISSISSFKLSGSSLDSALGAILNNDGGVLNVTATSTILNGSSQIKNDGITNLVLSNASVWNVKDNSMLSNLELIKSDIYISNEDGSPFQGNTLTVNGDFKGENGTLHFRTKLGDDSSLTDKLVVKGNTFGTTNVIVTNAGGIGAYTLNGIELISVDGSSDGDFVQASRIVAGAHEYSLARGETVDTNKNWYLTNFKKNDVLPPSSEKDDAVVMRPEGGSYIANLAAANTMFVTRLNDRSGETRYFDPVSRSEKMSSLWLRQIGGHTSWHDNSGQLKTTSNRYVSQLGGDIFKGTFTDRDSWRLGVMGGFGRTDSSTKSTVSGFKSKGSVEGYSSGLYATWYEDDSSKQGGYVDAWMQYNWFDNKVKGDGISSESYDSKGITASLETGYSLGLNGYLGLSKENYEWLIQPQVQVTWMGVKQDSHIESNGTHISNSSDDNIQTRLGLRTYIREQNEYRNQDGTDFEPYLEMNWINNSKQYGVSMNGVSVKQSGSRNIGEIKTGINGNLTSTTGVWGNVGVQIGDNGYNDTSVMLGLRYKF